jgi:diguanylate cyclase (GGDEF)-like protein
MSRVKQEWGEKEVTARRSSWRLAFEDGFEPRYQKDHRQRAVRAFRHSFAFIFLLYVLLSTGIYVFMPRHDVARWLSLYGWVAVVIGMVGAFSWIPRLDKWFHWFAGVGSCVAVALSVAVIGVVVDPVAGQLTQVAIMYAIVIIYSVVGLTFLQASLAGWIGGVLGTLLALGLDGAVNWDLLHRTYTGSSLLGMFIAYFAERRDRDLFVQTFLLSEAREKAEMYAEKLNWLSRQDALTGLANRRHFDETVQEEWRRAVRSKSPMAILMIDVDYFKHYNDVLGHVKGDGCLRAVAGIISTHARRPGDLAVRYGGEEFLLLYPNTDCDTACLQAQRLTESFREARIPQAPGLAGDYLTVSVGVAVAIPGMGVDEPEMLVSEADSALYEAKAAGRNGWRVAEEFGCRPNQSAVLERSFPE